MNKKYRFLIVFSLIFIVLFGSQYTSDMTLEELKDRYTNDQSQFIEIMGMPVHFRKEGSGPALVLIHGTASSLHTWDDWTEDLKDHFEVIRMDIPAFGLTGPHPESDYSMDTYVQFLHQFLQSQSIDSCYIAGNSLGGAIAWNYTIKHPNEVKKLILLDASGAPKNTPPPLIFRLANLPVLSHALKYITPRSIIEKNLKDVYFNDDKVTDELIDRYYHLARRTGNRQAFIDRARLKFELPTEQLKEISCPTLIQWGADDQWIPVADVEFFINQIESSQSIIYPDAGHVPMEEIPAQSANDAKHFLMKSY